MSTLTSTELSRLQRKRVTYAKQDVAKASDGSWYMLINRMNTSGKFPHKAPGSVGGPKRNAGIVLYGARLFAVPANLADRYDAHLAVILSFNSTTSANLAIFSPLNPAENMEVNPVDLTINGTGAGWPIPASGIIPNAGGFLANQYATTFATVTGVRTSLALNDAQGNAVTPQVGDLVWSVQSASSQLATPAAPADNIAYMEASVSYIVL